MSNKKDGNYYLHDCSEYFNNRLRHSIEIPLDENQVMVGEQKSNEILMNEYINSMKKNRFCYDSFNKNYSCLSSENEESKEIFKLNISLLRKLVNQRYLSNMVSIEKQRETYRYLNSFGAIKPRKPSSRKKKKYNSTENRLSPSVMEKRENSHSSVKKNNTIRKNTKNKNKKKKEKKYHQKKPLRKGFFVKNMVNISPIYHQEGDSNHNQDRFNFHHLSLSNIVNNHNTREPKKEIIFQEEDITEIFSDEKNNNICVFPCISSSNNNNDDDYISSKNKKKKQKETDFTRLREKNSLHIVSSITKTEPFKEFCVCLYASILEEMNTYEFINYLLSNPNCKWNEILRNKYEGNHSIDHLSHELDKIMKIFQENSKTFSISQQERDIQRKHEDYHHHRNDDDDNDDEQVLTTNNKKYTQKKKKTKKKHYKTPNRTKLVIMEREKLMNLGMRHHYDSNYSSHNFFLATIITNIPGGIKEADEIVRFISSGKRGLSSRSSMIRQLKKEKEHLIIFNNSYYSKYIDKEKQN